MNLEGVKALRKMEQKSIFGGLKQPLDSTDECQGNSECPDGMMEQTGVCKSRTCLGQSGWKYCDVE